MKWNLEIRPAARREFDDASDWYRDEDHAIRAKFVAAVRKTIKTVEQRPLAFPVVFGTSVRRANVRKFPYSVFFTLEGSLVIILSIFHDSRNPIIWRGRMD